MPETVKLWYPCKGEFLKEVEVPVEYEQKQTFSLVRYRRSIDKGLQRYKMVFVHIKNNEYEYDHEEIMT